MVLDSVGIGGAPDAEAFGDAGSATLQHVAAAVGGLALPHLAGLGLGHVAPVPGVAPIASPAGAFGRMVERSAGKDTTTGHWELAGVVLPQAFPTYPQGFPRAIMDAFEERIGIGTLGNRPASGTEIIEELGPAHISTGKPIVYTSADSVFQIATHVDVVPVERLYEMCRIARELLTGDHEVGRVIARPFEGGPGTWRRTPQRHDYAVPPPAPTVLDELVDAGLEVRGVGKISDIFCGRGVSSSRPTTSNDDGVDAIVEALENIERGLVFANLVDFDSAFGHRNDPRGYAGALESFDRRLPEILGALGPDDCLIITADHGNDPTTDSTDHSRERVPLLIAGDGIQAGADVGERDSFADCGATVATLLGMPTRTPGTSFAQAIRR